MKQKKESRLPLILFLGLLGLLGLAISRLLIGWIGFMTMQRLSPDLSPDLELLFDVKLQVEDLPPGWVREGASFVETPGGEGRGFGFVLASAPQELSWVRIGELVFVYESEELARERYSEEVELFSLSGMWEEVPELMFSHHADEIEVACMETSVNRVRHQSCTAVARYGQVVTVIMASVFEDQWLTMDEFQGVLEAADRRATAATGRGQ